MSDQIADETFRAELVPVIPHMRAFARSLTGNFAEAEDLAQEALAKAWRSRASYELGTSLKSWVFMIVRNEFYSQKRRSWRQVALDMDAAERTLVAVSDPAGALELNEARRALALLPDDQREALILIGVAGLAYEEAAEICDCPVGTVKSRVSRARRRMIELMEGGFLADDGDMPSDAMATLFADAERLQRRAA
ncbi:MAG TPA: sigma-70 family RNA polymerase sigma factor [Caulobacteraceae bacterium]|jgi:RNA polymerase sigma-70 factor (ECF subfamily)